MMKSFGLIARLHLVTKKMVWSKGSISLNGSIRRPTKPFSTAVDIPDPLQPAKIISCPCDEVN